MYVVNRKEKRSKTQPRRWVLLKVITMHIYKNINKTHQASSNINNPG